MSFKDLNLIPSLLDAIADAGYETPTPIQAQAIPPLLEGRDVLGCAQTGTGKTAAFSLPVLQHLAENPTQGKAKIRALVLTPTRELAAQIGESFAKYGDYLRLKHIVIFGGVNQNPQVRALRAGIDILVATPGRLLDLMGQGEVSLGDVEFFILDEADRMLDMGFIHDIKRVLKVLPKKRQNLLFSATMPRTIADLAGTFLTDPVTVEVTPQSTTVERIEQRVMFVERAEKRRLLADLILNLDVERAIVFTRTKHGANRLVKQLDRHDIKSAAIHGNKSQAARTRALNGFREGDIPILVATDIASRGIDVDDVTHVFNFDLPNEPESYVHRIGRTGRAGREGIAISFCDETEGAYLRAIEKITGDVIPVDAEHKYHFPAAIPPAKMTGKGPSRRGPDSGGGNRGGGNRGGGNRGGGGGGGGNGNGSGGGQRRRRR
ncbi:MAG: ATP-dependent RNA helicase RhlE [Bradymonadia bacterium]|jgi:ATP-dependent RNA helicase RhlE